MFDILWWSKGGVLHGESPPRIQWLKDLMSEAALVLDRKTTYNAGPVAGDIGPLVIGNFNETMHSYGLDRQFRGQIRGLEIYGSRISGRGALSLENK